MTKMKLVAKTGPDLALLLLLVILASIVRSINWGEIVAEGGFWIFPDDPPYHLRRAMMTLASWPTVPWVDPFVNYPYGSTLIWPPGMAWLLAGLTKLWGGQDQQLVLQVIATVLPPLIGGLTVGLVYFGGRLLGGRRLAVAAAVVLLFMPAHVSNTIVSRYDHHIFEPLISVLILLSIALAASRSGRGRAGWAAVGALSIGSGLLVWPGILYYLAFIVAALLLAILQLQRLDSAAASGSSSSARALALAAGSVFLGGALCALPALLSSPWSREPVFFAPSPLHLLCLLAAGLAFLLLACLPRALGAGASRWRGLAAVAAPASMLLLLPSMRNAITSGLHYLLASPFGQVAAESQSLVSWPMHLGTMTSWPALGGSLLAAGWIITALARGSWPALQAMPADRRLFSVVVLSSSALLLVPALTAERWINGWAPLGALGAAACWPLILSPLGARLMPGREGRYRVWTVLAALLLLVPSATYSLSLQPITHDKRVAQRMMFALRALSPPATEQEFSVLAQPRYGVLTDWDVGHAVAYLSGRPTLANNFFGMPQYDQANLRALELLLSTDCEAVAREMQQLQLRYLLLTATRLGHAALALGRDPRDFVDEQGKLARSALGTLLGRLMAHDGQALALRRTAPGEQYGREIVKECGNFRLLAEAHLSGSSRSWPSEFKIYEVVHGARLLIDVGAGDRVELALPLSTIEGRQLVWRALRAASAKQRQVEIVVPYATDGACVEISGECPVKPASPGGYYLKVGKWQGRVAVPAEAVLTGRTIPVAREEPSAVAAQENAPPAAAN